MSIYPQDSTKTALDPDVAGPGVMVGFILTGLLATVASGFSALLSSLRSSDKASGSGNPRWKVSALRLLKASVPDDADDPVEFWTPILEGFVLNLSDQQLITGLFLVILAFAKYFNTDHSSLSIAGDLAFFSMITHYATILIIQKMLREHFKLAVLRMTLVLVTFVMWFIMETKTSLSYVASLGDDMRFVPLLALFSSIIEAIGFLWIFWGMCLNLSSGDLTLEARRAIGRGDLADDVNRQVIAEWLDSYQHDHRMPKGIFDHIAFPLKRSLSWLFQKLTRSYVTTKSHSWENTLWMMAEAVFPFRLGYLLGASLFCLGIISLSLDLYLSGLVTTWGFGQLLPTLMVILPFFSLTEVYALSKLDLAKKKAQLAQQPTAAIAPNHTLPSTQQPILTGSQSSKDNTIRLQDHTDANRPQSLHQSSATPQGSEREHLAVTTSRETPTQPSRHRAIQGHSTW